MAKKASKPTHPQADRGTSGGSPAPLPQTQDSYCRCGCRRAETVGPPNRVEASGIREGKPYAAILRQRVRCLGCRQIRVETVYE